jgi:hypothetical protein
VNAARADLLPAVSQERVSRITPKRRPRKPSRLGAVLSSAFTWLFACAFAGASVIVAGVFVLAGMGWALISVGVFLFLVAGLLHVGIAHG